MTKIALVVFFLVSISSIQVVVGRTVADIAGPPQINERKEMFVDGLEAIVYSLVKDGLLNESKVNEDDFQKTYEVVISKEKDALTNPSIEETKVLLYAGLKYYIEQLASKGLIDRDAVEKKIYRVLPNGEKVILPELDAEVSQAFESPDD